MRLTQEIKVRGHKTYQFSNSEKASKGLTKLGQLEDILDKYGIDDLKILDELISVHKFLLDHKYKTMAEEDFDVMFSELKKYKDIEEELGIDLITLFKALDSFYAKDLDMVCCNPVSLFKTCGEQGEWHIGWMRHIYKLKDYGKTWALTKEELTDGK